jgi:hypothetical protein
MSFPRSSEVVRRYLARALQSDMERAATTPISLAGSRTNGRAPPPPEAPPISEVAMSGTPYAGRLKVREPEPGDEQAPYSRTELVRMNDEFCTRLERAFERGKESRQAAAATYNGNGALKQN